MNVTVSAPDPSGSVLVWLAAKEAQWETQLESPETAWGGTRGGWVDKKEELKRKKEQLSQLVMTQRAHLQCNEWIIKVVCMKEEYCISSILF